MTPLSTLWVGLGMLSHGDFKIHRKLLGFVIIFPLPTSNCLPWWRWDPLKPRDHGQVGSAVPTRRVQVPSTTLEVDLGRWWWTCWAKDAWRKKKQRCMKHEQLPWDFKCVYICIHIISYIINYNIYVLILMYICSWLGVKKDGRAKFKFRWGLRMETFLG